MPRQRSHSERRAMFRNMGTGARVKVVKPFGINDVPVGSEGIVVQHFGKDRNQPVVAFSGLGRRVLKPDVIEVIRPSNKFEPIRAERIKVYGTKSELRKKLIDAGFRHGAETSDYVYDHYHLDDGEGNVANPLYLVKVKDNAVEIELTKGIIPRKWRNDYDYILEGIEEKVKDALGVKN